MRFMSVSWFLGHVFIFKFTLFGLDESHRLRHPLCSVDNGSHHTIHHRASRYLSLHQNNIGERPSIFKNADRDDKMVGYDSSERWYSFMFYWDKFSPESLGMIWALFFCKYIIIYVCIYISICWYVLHAGDLMKV